MTVLCCPVWLPLGWQGDKGFVGGCHQELLNCGSQHIIIIIIINTIETYYVLLNANIASKLFINQLYMLTVKNIEISVDEISKNIVEKFCMSRYSAVDEKGGDQ